MSKIDCANYLKDRELENPLYRYFTRTGCSFCPASSEKAFYMVYKHFKEDWEYMKEIESRLNELETKGKKIVNRFWFRNHRSCADMEDKFKKLDMQKSLFELNDESLRDCFCRI